MTFNKVNPLILSIESSQSTCGICINSGNDLLAEYTIYQPNQHDRLLAELIRRIFNDLTITSESLDALAISAGPGSFTGLRIGSSIAKALCYDNKIKLISVPTLTAIAYYFSNNYNYKKYEKIVSLTPSHKTFIYYQIFDQLINPLADIELAEIDILKSFADAKTILTGPIKNIDNFSSFTPIQLNPRIIAEYALIQYQNSNFIDSEKFIPLYVQEFIPKISKK